MSACALATTNVGVLYHALFFAVNIYFFYCLHSFAVQRLRLLSHVLPRTFRILS